MRLAWRGLARGKNLVFAAVIAVLIGSAAVIYGVSGTEKPPVTLSERLAEPRQETTRPERAADSRQTTVAGGTAGAPPAPQFDVVELRRAELERDRNAPVLGNPDGDVTVVEFFDYNCPFCKKIADDLKALIEQDSRIRLVYREWPIINQGSQFAARAALAARRQGKYEELHWALMNQRQVTEQSTLRAAQAIGIDIPRLLADMRNRAIDRHLALSFDLARSLGINGTPSFVVGDRVVRGYVPIDQLTGYVREARAVQADRQRPDR